MPNDTAVPFPSADVIADEAAARREPIMKYFSFDHLKHEKAREVSKGFCILAEALHQVCPPGAERAVALRKLLEAKDAAVRSVLP